MSYDGLMLSHVIKDLKETLEGGRIDKIYQLVDFTFLFKVRARKSYTLLISASRHNSRMHRTYTDYEKPYKPPMFCMFLRKHLESGRIESIEQHGNDRLAVFTIAAKDELGETSQRQLIVELFGKDANIALCDEKRTILDALHHVHPFEENRTMISGATYRYPEDDRKNPFEAQAADTLRAIQSERVKDYLKAFEGISPLFIKEYLHRLKKGEGSPDDIFSTMLYEKNYHAKETDKLFFAPYTLTHIDGETIPFDDLNSMLDFIFQAREKKNQKQQHAKDLFRFVKRQIEKQTNKIRQVKQALKDSEEAGLYQKKGEILLSQQHEVQTGDRSVTLHDYYEDAPITIELDPEKTAVENSEIYFNRAKKLKRSVPRLKKELKKARREKAYFEIIEDQLERANFNELLDIREELNSYGYLRQQKKKRPQKASQHLTFIDPRGYEIMVGKNNRQNALITHEKSKHFYVWFHVKDAPGSHVVVKKGFPLEEDTIRTAAQLASVYSKMRYSSSVPVDYTEVRNIKKIPGQKPCFVTYTNQKTIYMDPDNDYVKRLKQK